MKDVFIEFYFISLACICYIMCRHMNTCDVFITLCDVFNTLCDVLITFLMYLLHFVIYLLHYVQTHVNTWHVIDRKMSLNLIDLVV